MRSFAIAFLILTFATPSLAVDYDEQFDGDLSDDPAAPTFIGFTPGSNCVSGSVFNSNAGDRDFLTFTVPPGATLINLNLVAYAPFNSGFIAVNAGNTSFIPSGATSASFLAGIHLNGGNVGSDLLPLFVSSSITGNSLPAANLGPGDYSVVIQQTGAITSTYKLEFVIQTSVAVEDEVWGKIKGLFR